MFLIFSFLVFAPVGPALSVLVWRAPRPRPHPVALWSGVSRKKAHWVLSSWPLVRRRPCARSGLGLWFGSAIVFFGFGRSAGCLSAPPCALPPSPRYARSVHQRARAPASTFPNGRPQSPTTTPLCRRVAKNPHIAYRHHVKFAVTRESDEGRAVGTFFVGSAPIPSPTGSV